jgi:hypothetical protein
VGQGVNRQERRSVVSAPALTADDETNHARGARTPCVPGPPAP